MFSSAQSGTKYRKNIKQAAACQPISDQLSVDQRLVFVQLGTIYNFQLIMIWHNKNVVSLVTLHESSNWAITE